MAVAMASVLRPPRPPARAFARAGPPARATTQVRGVKTSARHQSVHNSPHGRCHAPRRRPSHRRRHERRGQRAQRSGDAGAQRAPVLGNATVGRGGTDGMPECADDVAQVDPWQTAARAVQATQAAPWTTQTAARAVRAAQAVTWTQALRGQEVEALKQRVLPPHHRLCAVRVRGTEPPRGALAAERGLATRGRPNAGRRHADGTGRTRQPGNHAPTKTGRARTGAQRPEAKERQVPRVASRRRQAPAGGT